MAKYTKIPETGVAGSLSASLGKVIGLTTTTAIREIEKIRKRALYEVVSRIENLQETSEYDNISKEIEEITKSLEAVHRTVLTASKNVNRITSISDTLRIPVTALKAAILVIKVVPIPQATLPVSVTTIYSDLLETLSETVAQLEETCDSLEAVKTRIGDFLNPVQEQIQKIQSFLDNLKLQITIENPVQQSDKDKIHAVGVTDEYSRSVVNEVLLHYNDAKPLFIPIPCRRTDIDLESLQIRNKLTTAGVGTEISIGTGPGDYVKVIFSERSTVERPTEREVIPEGWTEIETKNVKWKSTGIYSKNTGKMGVWSSPEKYESKAIRGSSNSNIELTEFKVLLVDGNYYISNKPQDCIIRFKTQTEVDEFLQKILENAIKAGVSIEMQEGMQKILKEFQKESDSSATDSSLEWYRASNGVLYLIEVFNDSEIESVVPRRYAKVSTQSGVPVMIGPKTFAADRKIIIEDMKLRLDQIVS